MYWHPDLLRDAEINEILVTWFYDFVHVRYHAADLSKLQVSVPFHNKFQRLEQSVYESTKRPWPPVILGWPKFRTHFRLKFRSEGNLEEQTLSSKLKWASLYRARFPPLFLDELFIICWIIVATEVGTLLFSLLSFNLLGGGYTAKYSQIRINIKNKIKMKNCNSSLKGCKERLQKFYLTDAYRYRCI